MNSETLSLTFIYTFYEAILHILEQLANIFEKLREWTAPHRPKVFPLLNQKWKSISFAIRFDAKQRC